MRKQMGYTHYWRHNFNEALNKQENYAKCIEDMMKIVEHNKAILNVEENDEYDIFFNGIGDDEHETFVFPPKEEFDFCKTAHKPYDIVVVACLAVAKDIFSDKFRTSSDGEPEDWEAGVRMASEVLGRQIKMPLG